MKLTASTSATASINTRTNSPTDLDTAAGWSCTRSSVMPAGNSAHNSSLRLRSAWPNATMSPPLAIETPSAITALPWVRALTPGGSSVPRRTY